MDDFHKNLQDGWERTQRRVHESEKRREAFEWESYMRETQSRIDRLKLLSKVKHDDKTMNNIKTEGTVQLSIAELDNLRGQILALTAEKEDLLKHQGEVRVAITVTEKYSSMDTVPEWNWAGDRSKQRYRFEQSDKYRVIQENETYVNLDDVRKNIIEDARTSVITEMGTLERQADSLRRDIEKLRTNNQKDTIHLNELHDKEIIDVKQRCLDEIKLKQVEVDTKQSEVDRLNGVVADKTKDQIITELQQQLQELRLKKGFWRFLHS